MNAKIAVIGFVRFPPERMEELRPHVQALVEATRAHDGCIAYDVAEDVMEPGLLRFSEFWPDAESLARHIQAPHVQPWREASQACGLLEKRYHVIDVAAVRML
jgi:quinol monooxygenase YgiN